MLTESSVLPVLRSVQPKATVAISMRSQSAVAASLSRISAHIRINGVQPPANAEKMSTATKSVRRAAALSVRSVNAGMMNVRAVANSGATEREHAAMISVKHRSAIRVAVTRVAETERNVVAYVVEDVRLNARAMISSPCVEVNV